MADRRYTINAYTVNLLPFPVETRGTKAEFPVQRLSETKDPALLDLLAQEDVRATFFADGSLARHSPDLLREIAERGHEVGLLVSPTAGAGNFPTDEVDESGTAQLRRTILEGKEQLESRLQRRVIGCRILPFSSSGSRSLREYQILAEAGFAYSSSVYPPREFRFGLQNSKRRAWTVELQENTLWELPLTAWRLFGLGIVSIRSAHPERHPTWAIARSIEGMNRHGEPALLSQHCDVPPFTTALTITETTAERLKHIFRAYRFSTTFDAFASRLIRGFDDEEQKMGRRTSIIRCDARTAATIL